MNYTSTRDEARSCSAAEAIVQGLAPDGGLLTPEVLPRLPEGAVEALQTMSYQQRAVYIMSLFLKGFTTAELARYAGAAYGPDRFDCKKVAPLHHLDASVSCLELWHGPTCAFKDMALQMLPHLLTASLEKTETKQDVCILVATSGDTGKAALEGFRDVPHTKILVFYPKDGVSAIQEWQMVTQTGGNVSVCAVEGNFDDAQTGVKQIFSDETIRANLAQQGWFLSSANSINWGRLLPQIVYYVSAYADLVQEGRIQNGDAVNFCVPTGNFGNILAAYFAKQMGLPVGRLLCASNQNNVLTDFIRTGVYDRNRPFFNTISPSMDILISSNLERLLYLLAGGNAAEISGYMASLKQTGTYTVRPELLQKIESQFYAGFCDDATTEKTIRQVWDQFSYLIDPHTAVAVSVLNRYRQETGDRTPSVIVSTASPFKFCDSVLSALGQKPLEAGTALLDQLSRLTGVAVPAPLARLQSSKRRFEDCVETGQMAEKVLELIRRP